MCQTLEGFGGWFSNLIKNEKEGKKKEKEILDVDGIIVGGGVLFSSFSTSRGKSLSSRIHTLHTSLQQADLCSNSPFSTHHDQPRLLENVQIGKESDEFRSWEGIFYAFFLFPYISTLQKNVDHCFNPMLPALSKLTTGKILDENRSEKSLFGCDKKISANKC